MKWNGLPLVIFGSGGISKETYSLLKEINSTRNQQVFEFLGFVGENDSENGTEVIDGFKIISSDKGIEEFVSSYKVIGMVIPIGTPKVKSIIYNRVKDFSNVVFPNLIHPGVKFDKDNVEFGEGNIIASGSNLTCHIKIGNFNLVNLNSTIGHDTQIGDFNVINPLVAISGQVTINDACLVGTGAKILQGVSIYTGATVGAGAVVIKDVDQNETVVGVPAKRK